jgi:hypothetical protein
MRHIVGKLLTRATTFLQISFQLEVYTQSCGTPKSRESQLWEFGCHNPTLRKCEDETHTPEMGTWKSSGTPEIQNSITRVKTPRIGAFFISLESYQNVNVESGLA